MTDFEQHLWSTLVSQHAADRVRAQAAPPQPRRKPLVLGGAAMCAGGVAAVVAVLMLTATGATSKAYALTQNADGSYTLTMNDAATAIPQVNAEFAKLGIPAKVIPVTANCTVQNTGGISLNPPTEGVGMSYAVTFSKDVPAGWTDFIAAEQTPSGVRETYGSSSQPLPACLNANQAPPVTVAPTTTPTGTTSNSTATK